MCVCVYGEGSFVLTYTPPRKVYLYISYLSFLIECHARLSRQAVPSKFVSALENKIGTMS